MRLILVIAFLVLGCTGESDKKISDESQKLAEQEKHKKDFVDSYNKKLVPVASKEIEKKKIIRYFSSSAYLDPFKSVNLKVTQGEYVKKIFKKVGDSVQKDEIIAEMASFDIDASYKKAKINFENAKRPYLVNKKLFKKNLISKDDWEKSKYSYQSAKLDLESASNSLKKLKILAPISGIVALNDIEELQPISMISDKPIRIVDQKKLKGSIFVPVFYSGTIKVGDQIEIIRGKETLLGNLDRISPIVDRSTGTIRMDFSVLNESNSIHSGESVDVKVALDQGSDRLVLPENSVFFEGSKAYVFAFRETTEKEASSEFEKFMKNFSEPSLDSVQPKLDPPKKPDAKTTEKGPAKSEKPVKEKLDLSKEELTKLTQVKRAEKIQVTIEQLPSGQYALMDSLKNQLNIGSPLIIVGLSQINDGTKIEIIQ